MMKRDLKADLERRANNDSDTECRSLEECDPMR
jgi:hypothetical protein